MVYLVNKPISAVGISEDMPKAERYMNSWPRSEASRATVKFEDNLSAEGIIHRYTSKPERGLFIL